MKNGGREFSRGIGESDVGAGLSGMLRLAAIDPIWRRRALRVARTREQQVIVVPGHP
jgi:hypothetical protein